MVIVEPIVFPSESPSAPTRITPPKSTVDGVVSRNGALLISLPVREIGKMVAKPGMALFVVIVRGVDLKPGLVLPNEAFTALATTA
jgi:hypothetical protein